MATLEVHDPRGRVERVTISRDQPVLFGSSPKCEIVLSGPGVLPFHGRLRWKGSRYKADASPDAQFLEINGRKMASASVRQGDEIVVGDCRIFMLHADEDLPREDVTRVQPAPVLAPQATARPETSVRRPGSFDRPDFLKDLDVAPPSTEMPLPSPAVLPRGGHRSRPAPSKPVAAGPSKRPRGRSLAELWRARGAAPGQERILTSPLVFGLVVTLALLVVLGVMLKGIIDRTITSRLYQRALTSFDDGDYRNAIQRFDAYLARGSGDPLNEGKARVFRALANVRQYTSTTGASWSNALAAEREMLAKVGREPSYRDSSTELAELVLKTGEALADRARTSADARVLAQAEFAVGLHAEITGKNSPALVARSRLPARLAEARASVRKEAARARALAAMDSALKAGSSSGVYEARDVLVRLHADQAEDREIVGRLTRANDLVRRAVKFDESRRPAETEPLPEPFGPPTTLVLRSPSPEVSTKTGPVVFALADGLAYGLDGGSGAPLWQTAVGPSASFPPQPIPGAPGAALVFDARSNELARLDARTGALVWRQEIGEPVADPSLVLGNQVIQATHSGKVLKIDLGSGALQGSWSLGMPLARTPVSDEAGEFLYILGVRDCLFILRRDPPGCEAVEYLGHGPGAVACAPARLGRFLIVPENHTLSDGRWRVCVIDEDGARVRPVQLIATSGWAWSTPAASGAVVWAAGDRGGVAAFAVGAYDARTPFKLVARLNPESESTGPSFALARAEDELWLSSGRPGRYNLDLDKATITKAWALASAGPALGPIQTAGPLAVLTHQPIGRAGSALWGVDPETGAVRWQTIVGASWLVVPNLSKGGQALSTLSPQGQVLELSRPALSSGGFVASTLPKAGEFQLPPGPLHRLETDGLTVLVPGSGSRTVLVRLKDAPYRQVELPVAPGASPILWGGEILLPGQDGRAYLIDPESGESKAEPLVPAFDRDHRTRWRAPVLVDGGAVALADESGRVRRLSLVKDPRPRLVASAEASLGKELLKDPASTGNAVVVITTDDRVRSLAARDLSPVGAWALDAPPVGSPVAVSGLAFVADRAGGVLALGGDGQRLWSSSLQGGSSTGPPVVLDRRAWFLTKAGSLEARDLGDGARRERMDLGIVPAGGLRLLGSDLVIPSGGGTIRLLSPNRPARDRSGEK